MTKTKQQTPKQTLNLVCVCVCLCVCVLSAYTSKHDQAQTESLKSFNRTLFFFRIESIMIGCVCVCVCVCVCLLQLDE